MSIQPIGLSIRDTIAPPDTSPPPAHRLRPVGPGSPTLVPVSKRAVADRSSVIAPRWKAGAAGLASLAIDGLWFRVALAAILAIGAMALTWALQLSSVETSGPTASIAPAASVGVVVTPVSASASAVRHRSHVVASGDTLIALATRYYGDESRWPDILDANLDRIGDPANLRIGIELRIPDP